MSAAYKNPEFDRHPFNSNYYHSLARKRYTSFEADEIRQEFLFRIAEALADPHKFDKHQFRSYSLPLILEYLANTHDFYLQRCLPEIEQSLESLAKISEQRDHFLSATSLLFLDFKRHLISHIQLEEEKLFPAIQYRIGVASNEIPLQQFSSRMDNSDLEIFSHEHSDEEEQTVTLLKALANIKSRGTLHRVLTNQIINLQNDLLIHAKIEEEILIPRAKQLFDNK